MQQNRLQIKTWFNCFDNHSSGTGHMCLQQQHKQKTFANPSKNIAEKKKEQKTKGKTIAKLIALAQTQKEKL